MGLSLEVFQNHRVQQDNLYHALIGVFVLLHRYLYLKSNYYFFTNKANITIVKNKVTFSLTYPISNRINFFLVFE